MKKFKVGDKVEFNSESGIARGVIIKIYTKPFILTGKDGTKYTRHATRVNPQYAIKSDISDHVAHHFGRALKKI